MAVVKRSRYSYPETVARLSAAIEAAGNRIFAVIDQAAAAQAAGLTLRPTSLIVFGNPKAGTGLMEAFPLVALDLPLKLLVWADTEGVAVAYTQMAEIASRYSVVGRDAQIAAMDAALGALTDSVG